MPDHQADLVGGAEALRKAIFAALRMFADEGRVYMMYAGFGADGTFAGYYGAGQSSRSTSDRRLLLHAVKRMGLRLELRGFVHGELCGRLRRRRERAVFRRAQGRQPRL